MNGLVQTSLSPTLKVNLKSVKLNSKFVRDWAFITDGTIIQKTLMCLRIKITAELLQVILNQSSSKWVLISHRSSMLFAQLRREWLKITMLDSSSHQQRKWTCQDQRKRCSNLRTFHQQLIQTWSQTTTLWTLTLSSMEDAAFKAQVFLFHSLSFHLQWKHGASKNQQVTNHTNSASLRSISIHTCTFEIKTR